jgi:hypothetical protein
VGECDKALDSKEHAGVTNRWAISSHVLRVVMHDEEDHTENETEKLVATYYRRSPHIDTRVEVRRIFHKLRSVAEENYNDHFKGEATMPEKYRCSNFDAREKNNRQHPSAILIAVLVALLSLLPALYTWIVRFALRRNLRSLSAGDFEPLFSTYTDDIRFVFPGHNSWAGEFRGREKVEQWVRRVYQVGLRLEPHEILAKGLPWDTTVCLRFTDRCTATDGTIVYSNRGMVFGKIVWGKITYYEIHEDTEKVVALDEYVALHEPTGA